MEKELWSYKVKELKEILRSYQLLVSDNKEDLIYLTY